jgi:hypothetical protein
MAYALERESQIYKAFLGSGAVEIRDLHGMYPFYSHSYSSVQPMNDFVLYVHVAPGCLDEISPVE